MISQENSPEPPETADAQDLALMLKVKSGDMEAFRELVEVHQSRVIGTVCKMLGDDTDSEDLSQQVFIRVWKSADRYQPTAKFTTWLFKITRNLVFNELRRRKRHPGFSMDAELEPGEAPRELEDVHAPSPSTELLEDELQTAIQKAIDALPETQRMAVILRRYEELSYQEIGDILGLSVSAVKSVLFRARAELKDHLSKYLE